MKSSIASFLFYTVVWIVNAVLLWFLFGFPFYAFFRVLYFDPQLDWLVDVPTNTPPPKI